MGGSEKAARFSPSLDRATMSLSRFYFMHSGASSARIASIHLACLALAQFANCVLALCVIDEIVINSMTSGKIMEIRPPVS